MTEFRFSPRPNRAGEIAWMPWGAPAFERAEAEDKPILLSISAVWCHWCHVMDETSYSDSGVIDAVNRDFVAVRVDNDRRPDVNARYNMGGWPTTAFLTPDGTTLTGATYLPPEQMRAALEQIARFYAERKGDIAQRAGELRAQAEQRSPESGDMNGEPADALVEALEGAYDEEYGGFGDEPKFPQPEVHEFLLAEWRRSGSPRLHEIVARTMLAMSRGGTYDHVEGGFFRYSTTRDWSVPHFEKMAEDHAGLLRVLAGLVLYAPTADFRAALTSAVGYVRAVLRDPRTGFFAGSQDADEAYYELPLEQRRAREAPFVDRTSYTNWTCALAGALCLAARALDDDALLAEALRALDNVALLLSAGDGLLYHVLPPGGEPQVRGLLADHVAYVRALLDAHEICGEARFLQRARATADAVIAQFQAPGGGYYDRLASDDAFGRLALRRPSHRRQRSLRRVAAAARGAHRRSRLSGTCRGHAADLRSRRARRRAVRRDVRARAAALPVAGTERADRRRSRRDRRVSRDGAAAANPLRDDSHADAGGGAGARDAGRRRRSLRVRGRRVRRAGSRSGRAARSVRRRHVRTKLSQYQQPHRPAATEYAISARPHNAKRSRTASIISATRNGSKSSAWRIPNCAKPFT